MPALDEVLRHLPQLSGPELDQVRARISFLRGLSGPEVTAQPQTDDEGLILGLICEVTAKADPCTLDMLRRSSQYPAFKRKLPAIMSFIRSASPTSVGQRAVLHIALDLLYEYLVKIGIPTGGRQIMQHIHRLPGVVNMNFPGYAQSGLLGMIVRRADHVR